MIKPIGERVLIKKIVEKIGEGDVEYAEINASEFTSGEVVAWSELFTKHSDRLEGVRQVPKIGDTVIISNYAPAEEYKEGDDLYKIVEVKHIVAVK